MQDTNPTKFTLPSPQDDARVVSVYQRRVPFDALRTTADPEVKFCDQCAQRVYRVRDFDGFARAVASRLCVWGENDLRPTGAASKQVMLGLPMMPRESLKWED
jgi:hypothetical protein